MAKRRNNDLDLTEPTTLNSEEKSEVLGEVSEELLDEITEEVVGEIVDEVAKETEETPKTTVDIETLTDTTNSTEIQVNAEYLSVKSEIDEKPETTSVTTTLSEVENENTLNIGDNVKIMPAVNVDMFGKRIHNGIKNYVYKVINVRNDGYCTIKCLNYKFTLSVNKLIKQ